MKRHFSASGNRNRERYKDWDSEGELQKIVHEHVMNIKQLNESEDHTNALDRLDRTLVLADLKCDKWHVETSRKV